MKSVNVFPGILPEQFNSKVKKLRQKEDVESVVAVGKIKERCFRSQYEILLMDFIPAVERGITG